MTSSNQPNSPSELTKDNDNTLPGGIETLLGIFKTLESLKTKEEQCILFDKMKDLGLLHNLVDLLAQCESDVVSKLFISIIRKISRCKDNKYIQIMIDHAHCLQSSLQTPTFGIFCVFEALSWCDITIRSQIVNKDTLNYVLSNINVKNIQNETHLAIAQSRLLFVLMHLEYSVKGHFVAEQLNYIANILNHFLTMQ
eukprot:72230_1